MLILGGHNSRAALSDVHVLSVESVTWETIEVAGVAPVCGNRHATAPPPCTTSTLTSTTSTLTSTISTLHHLHHLRHQNRQDFCRRHLRHRHAAVLLEDKGNSQGMSGAAAADQTRAAHPA